MERAPHQQRVINEKGELDLKLTALRSFIKSPKFEEIVKDEAERYRLTKQEIAMSDYSAVLADRIAAF